jgi:hypothetical protein
MWIYHRIFWYTALSTVHWQKVCRRWATSPFLVGLINRLQGLPTGATEKVKYGNKTCGSTIASPNILRFPWASGEPPRTTVLRGLTDLLLPTGVFVYSRCLVKWKNKIFRSITFSVAFYRTKGFRRSFTSHWGLRIFKMVDKVK